MAQAYLDEDLDYDHIQMESVSSAEYDIWFREKVEAGEQAYREGRFVTQEEAILQAMERRRQILASLAR